ncbi:MAG: SGNH/GDSL hydrolase family protein [Lentisphaerae bacterium]|jgi:lysophospholipase L1-like esterase|nr:SGNH/GDSL hydrolase family protein [Lentisphaerota bacterium]
MKKRLFSSLALFSLSALAAVTTQVFDFNKSNDSWDSPSYWSGKISWASSGAMKLEATEKNGRFWGRSYRVSKMTDLAGRTYTITAKVKGEGKAKIGAIIYTKGKTGNDIMSYSWGDEQALTSDWQEFCYDVNMAYMKPFMLALCVEITTAGELLVDEISVGLNQAAQQQIDPRYADFVKTKTLFSQDFSKDIQGWASHDYWSGVLSHAAEGHTRLQSQLKGNREWGKAIYIHQNPKGFAGNVLNYSMHLKGSGKARIGCIAYQKDLEGKTLYPTEWTDEIELGETWQKIEQILDFSERAPFMLGLCIELTNAGEVCFDNVELFEMANTELTLVSLSSLAPIVREGDILPDLVFKVSEPGLQTVAFLPQPPATDRAIKVLANENGIANVATTGLAGTSTVTLAAKGNTVSVDFDIMPVSEYDAFDAVAQKIKAENKINVLVLADSLLDFDRGKNAIDKFQFWLDKYNPGQFNIRNAAVRGDYITRVWERMTKKGVYRAETYDKLFEFPADIIMIQLGHNDTRASSADNFATPLISPDKQQSEFKLVLDKLRQNWPQARIILVSSASQNHELTWRGATANVKRGRKNVVCFAIPKFQEAWNATLKQIADEHKIEYYDIYTEMQNVPNKNALFSPNDGVHLTQLGHRYFALQYLKYFANTMAR